MRWSRLRLALGFAGLIVSLLLLHRSWGWAQATPTFVLVTNQASPTVVAQIRQANPPLLESDITTTDHIPFDPHTGVPIGEADVRSIKRLLIWRLGFIYGIDYIAVSSPTNAQVALKTPADRWIEWAFMEKVGGSWRIERVLKTRGFTKGPTWLDRICDGWDRLWRRGPAPHRTAG